MLAIASLFMVVLVVLLIARIATVALVATGLPFELARFQARSALTGVGFTTTESESVVGHPIRRRVVLTLMLVGNAGFITLIASVMLSFSSSPSSREVAFRLGVVIGGLLLIALVARSQVFERNITALIARVVDRFTDLDLRDYHHILQLSNDYAVTELQVKKGDWLAGRNLMQLELPNEGVLVLAIHRANGDFIGAPRGGTVIEPGDTVVLYGRSSVLSDLDDRPASPAGDHAHDDAVAEQSEIMAHQSDEELA